MTVDPEIIKDEITGMIAEEFEHMTYKEAALTLGISESNYWRFMNDKSLGGKTLLSIVGYLIERGTIFIPRG